MSTKPLATFVNSRLRTEIRRVSAEVSALRSQVERMERHHQIIDEALAHHASAVLPNSRADPMGEAADIRDPSPNGELSAMNRGYQLLLHPDLTVGGGEDSSALNAAANAGDARAASEVIARAHARFGSLGHDDDGLVMVCAEYFYLLDQRTLLGMHLDAMRASTRGQMLADLDAAISDDLLRETVGNALRYTVG